MDGPRGRVKCIMGESVCGCCGGSVVLWRKCVGFVEEVRGCCCGVSTKFKLNLEYWPYAWASPAPIIEKHQYSVHLRQMS